MAFIINETIVRPIFRKAALIGHFYDIRNEKLILEKYLFKSDIPPSAIHSQTLNGYKSEIFFDDNIHDMLAFLGIECEAKLSILSGIIQNDGILLFLNEIKNKQGKNKIYFFQQFTTTLDSIDVKNEMFKDLFKKINIDATHVVTGATWGCNMISCLSFDNDLTSDLKNRIKADFERIQSIEIPMEKLVRELPVFGYLSKLKFNVYSDDGLLRNGINPNTNEEFVGIIRNFSQRKSYARRKENQLKLHLLPLTTLKAKLDHKASITKNFEELELKNIKKCEKFFDHLILIDSKICELKQSLIGKSAHGLPEILNRVNNCASEFSVYIGKIQKAFATILIKVRSKKNSIEKLQNFVKAFEHVLKDAAQFILTTLNVEDAHNNPDVHEACDKLSARMAVEPIKVYKEFKKKTQDKHKQQTRGCSFVHKSTNSGTHSTETSSLANFDGLIQQLSGHSKHELQPATGLQTPAVTATNVKAGPSTPRSASINVKHRSQKMLGFEKLGRSSLTIDRPDPPPRRHSQSKQQHFNIL